MGSPIYSQLTSINDELIRSYIFYSSIVIFKVLLMSTYVSLLRIKHKAFLNPEDTQAVSKGKVRIEESIERVRRAHLNDLENAIPFVIVGAMYIMTNPSVSTTNLLFKIFTVSRILHTFVYAVYVVPQPARILSCVVGYFITLYMAMSNAMYFFN